MPNILLVTDTTSTLSPAEAKKYNIECLPLSVIIDGKEYRDHIDMSAEELAAALKAGAIPTTSQPNIGAVEEAMKTWKKANYDAIIIVTISSFLSGTYQGFKLCAQSCEMDNVHVIDSGTVGAPMLDILLCAKKWIEAGVDLETILNHIEAKKKDTFSFLYPETLEQLKKGGRISSVAAGMASLLKIKPLLSLEPGAECIEKFAMARTESKVFDLMVEEFKKRGVSASTHSFYIMEAEGMEIAVRFANKLKENFDDIDVQYVQLPAVLVSHAGLGCIAVQSCLRID